MSISFVIIPFSHVAPLSILIWSVPSFVFICTCDFVVSSSTGTFALYLKASVTSASAPVAVILSILSVSTGTTALVPFFSSPVTLSVTISFVVPRLAPWAFPFSSIDNIAVFSASHLYSSNSLFLSPNTLNVFAFILISSISLISKVLFSGSISKFLSPTNVCTRLLYFVVLWSFSLVPFPSSPRLLSPAEYINPVFEIINVLLYPAPILNTLVPFSKTCVGFETSSVEFNPNCPFIFSPHVYAFSSTL